MSHLPITIAECQEDQLDNNCKSYKLCTTFTDHIPTANESK